METKTFIDNFSKLTYNEQSELLNSLKNTLSASKPIAAHRKTRDKQCQYCGSFKVYKHGKTSIDAQRFRCFKCGTCFNMLTGTSINFVKKKDLLDRFIGLMLESKSIRYTAKELNIDPRTAFDWRHKVLSSFNDLFQKKFGKEVEIDPLLFRLNQKGRRKGLVKTAKTKKGRVKDKACVLFMMDRNKTFDFKVVKIGKKLKQAELNASINKDKLVKTETIYSDSEQTIVKFFEKMNVEHKTFVVNKGSYGKGKVHVNTLNNTKSRIDGWITYNFNAVATKYLRNYLNWFVVLEIMKRQRNKSNKFWDYIMKDGKAQNAYKSIEMEYQKLLKTAKLV